MTPMPATYAHYRFGARMLTKMPADVCRTAKRHRRLFDVGLHGPDLFFYYKPVFPTKVGRLGHKFHRQTGKEFFSRVCRNLRLEPGEEGLAYLYGVLCHYTLDTHCHPLVEKLSWEGVASHTRIETEFDRFLMDLDSRTQPCPVSLTKHLVLTDSESSVVSRFYPGTEPGHIRESLKGMVNIHKVLELPYGPVRTLMTKTMGVGSETFRDMVAGKTPDPVCRELNQPLLERYQQAATVFPEMLLQIGAHLTYNAPLGEEFTPIFG